MYSPTKRSALSKSADFVSLGNCSPTKIGNWWEYEDQKNKGNFEDQNELTLRLKQTQMTSQSNFHSQSTANQTCHTKKIPLYLKDEYEKKKEEEKRIL